MRTHPLLWIVLVCSCSTTAVEKEPDRPSVAALDPSSPLERCLSFYARAIRADEEGNHQEAGRLTKAAFGALDPETAKNLGLERLQLVNDLYGFSRKLQKEDRSEAWSRFVAEAWERYRRADQLYWTTEQARSARVAGSPRPRTTDTWEKPVSFDIYRPTPPRTVARVEQDTGSGKNTQPLPAAESPTPAPSRDPAPVGVASGASATGKGAAPRPTQRVAFEKQMLEITLLLTFRRVAQARAMLDGVLRDLDGTEPADAASTARTRALLAQMQAEPEPSTASRAAPEAIESSLQSLADALAADPTAGAAIGVSLPRVGDLLFRAGRYDEARRVYEDLTARLASRDVLDPEKLHARMGLARIADATGRRALSLSDCRQLLNDLQRKHPPDHPFVLEAQERYAHATRDEQGDDACRALLEKILADQERTLAADHPAIRSTRRMLADTCADRDPERALALRLSALQSQRRTARDDQPTGADVELVELLDRVGDSDAAFDVLHRTWLESARASEAPGSLDSLQRMRAEALRLQSVCQLEKALELRRRIVEQQRRTVAADHPERIEGLRELAALLRVLGRAEEARSIEVEAQLLNRRTPEKRERLSAWKAAALARREQAIDPPRVELHVDGAAAGGSRTVVAEIDDPVGVFAVDVVQDGIPRLVSLDAGEWTLDPSGIRARLEIRAAVPEDRPTKISVVVTNLRHVQSHASIDVK